MSRGEEAEGREGLAEEGRRYNVPCTSTRRKFVLCVAKLVPGKMLNATTYRSTLVISQDSLFFRHCSQNTVKDLMDIGSNTRN